MKDALFMVRDLWAGETTGTVVSIDPFSGLKDKKNRRDAKKLHVISIYLVQRAVQKLGHSKLDLCRDVVFACAKQPYY